MSVNINKYDISDVYIGETHIDKIYIGDKLVYSKNTVPIPQLYFEAVDSNIQSSVSISMVADATYDPEQGTVPGFQTPSFEYSYNGTTWTAYTLGNQVDIGGADPKRVYFRGDNYGHSWYDSSGTNARIRPEVAITGGFVNSGGNIMSLLWKDILTPRLTLPFDHTFYDFFNACEKLVTPPEFPATTVGDYDYYRTFLNCTALKRAPELPATTLGTYCYGLMFSGCTAMESGPSELPATTLTPSCYRSMFRYCVFEVAPEIKATVADQYSCYYMFRDCTGLLEAPELHLTTLAACSCQYMFQDCTSLRKPTKLPATTLASSCYMNMFTNCPLDYVPELPATTISGSAYRAMFSGSGSGIRAGASQSANLPYAYRIPTTGTGTAGSNAMTTMFRNEDNSGTFVPTVNTTFYVSKPILT